MYEITERNISANYLKYNCHLDYFLICYILYKYVMTCTYLPTAIYKYKYIYVYSKTNKI